MKRIMLTSALTVLLCGCAMPSLEKKPVRPEDFQPVSLSDDSVEDVNDNLIKLFW